MLFEIFFSFKTAFPIFPVNLQSNLLFFNISHNSFAVVDLPLVPVIAILKLSGYVE